MSEQIINETISFLYQPYEHQLPVWNALRAGYNRFISVWHRRAGKDLTFWNMMIMSAMRRVGSYYYFFPTYTQGKKIVWDGSDNDGARYIDYIPQQLVFSTNETELQITLVHPLDKDKPGSILQIIGADKMNFAVGTNPVGCIFSEYSVMRPSAWELMDPVLAANGGWAAFAYTPRGRNHGFKLFENARKMPDIWFSSLLTINDTRRHDGSPIVPMSYIEQKRREGADEDILQQEYFCSFNGSQQGSYYGTLLNELIAQGRLGDYPYDPSLPVNTAWDIGIGDANAIWFYQEIGDRIRVIDYLEGSNKGLEDWAKELYRKPYAIREYIAPHDIENREWGSGRARKEMALDFGIRFKTMPKLLVEDGIQAVRMLLPRCEFNEATTRKGFDALTSYHKEYDEERACFKDKPEHDWASHGADAFRMLALAVKPINRKKRKRFDQAVTAFDPHNDYDVRGDQYTIEFDPHAVEGVF